MSREVVFSKAQMRRFNDLQAEVRRAQEELQRFVTYLSEEHELDPSKEWQIGSRGFVENSKNGSGPSIDAVEATAGEG